MPRFRPDQACHSLMSGQGPRSADGPRPGRAPARRREALTGGRAATESPRQGMAGAGPRAPSPPAYDRPARCAGAPRCTSEESKTHRIDVRVVRYRWHPWCGRDVVVTGSFVRGGARVLCCRTDDGGPVPVEIPEWMFDVQSCMSAALSQVPSVDSATLCAMQELLDAHAPASGDVVETQHHSPNSGADADANDSAIDGRTDRSFPRATRRKRSRRGDQPQDPQFACPNVPRVRRKVSSRSPGRNGGG